MAITFRQARLGYIPNHPQLGLRLAPHTKGITRHPTEAALPHQPRDLLFRVHSSREQPSRRLPRVANATSKVRPTTVLIFIYLGEATTESR